MDLKVLNSACVRDDTCRRMSCTAHQHRARSTTEHPPRAEIDKETVRPSEDFEKGFKETSMAKRFGDNCYFTWN